MYAEKRTLVTACIIVLYRWSELVWRRDNVPRKTFVTFLESLPSLSLLLFLDSKAAKPARNLARVCTWRMGYFPASLLTFKRYVQHMKRYLFVAKELLVLVYTRRSNVTLRYLWSNLYTKRLFMNKLFPFSSKSQNGVKRIFQLCV